MKQWVNEICPSLKTGLNCGVGCCFLFNVSQTALFDKIYFGLYKKLEVWLTRLYSHKINVQLWPYCEVQVET